MGKKVAYYKRIILRYKGKDQINIFEVLKVLVNEQRNTGEGE